MRRRGSEATTIPPSMMRRGSLFSTQPEGESGDEDGDVKEEDRGISSILREAMERQGQLTSAAMEDFEED